MAGISHMSATKQCFLVEDGLLAHEQLAKLSIGPSSQERKDLHGASVLASANGSGTPKIILSAASTAIEHNF